MATLEYVASGTSHMRILNNALMTRPHIVNKINEYFVDLNNKNNLVLTKIIFIKDSY